MEKENFQAKNVSKIERDELIHKLEELKEQISDDERQTINQVIRKLKEKSKLGLNFDHFEEEIDEILKNNIPVLTKVEEKRINESDKLDYNFLIEGDNLPALQLLNKTHKGKIDVIYIDPPYNAEAANVIYKDSYPRSEWLSMMKSRLIMAHQLLSEFGCIYISIDENYFAELKILLDDVFGSENFIENFIWVKNTTKSTSKTTSTVHEYIYCYAKNKINLMNLENNVFVEEKELAKEWLEYVEMRKKEGYPVDSLKKELKIWLEETKAKLEFKDISVEDRIKVEKVYKWLKNYQNIDDNYRTFTSDNPGAPAKPKDITKIKNYDIINPFTGEPSPVPRNGWRWVKEKAESHIKNDLLIFKKDNQTIPRFKRLLETTIKNVKSSVIFENRNGKDYQIRLLGEEIFPNSKPVDLIKTILLSHPENATVLDFFAGSGTTAQAVMELNQEDDGNRNFILITNNEEIKELNKSICADITYPRIKAVIEGSKKYTAIPNNLMYQKIDFIDKESIDIENGEYLYDELLNHCKELIELKHMCKLNTNGIYYVNSNEEITNIILNNEVTDIYYSKDEFNINKNNMIALTNKNINIHVIPNCFFEKELRENGEL